MKMVTSSSVTSQRKTFFRDQILWLQPSNSILLDTLPARAQNDRNARNLEGAWPLWPFLATPLVTGKESKRKNSAYLMFNHSRTKSSPKTARHCRAPMKINIVSIGCYVGLLSI